MPIKSPTSFPDGGYLVIDDLLDRRGQSDIWNLFLQAQFHSFNEKKLNRVFGLSAPDGYWGEIYRIQPDGSRPNGANEVPAAIATLGERILKDRVCQEFLANYPGWNQMSFQPFIYPIGTGVTWHLDSGDTGRLGAHIYYAHPVWHASWGGELLIGPASSAKLFDSTGNSHDSPFLRMCQKFDTSLLLDGAIPHCIFPKPNRLVLIKGGVPHAIKKVEPSAGEAFRASVSGFFYKKALSQKRDGPETGTLAGQELR